MKRGRILPGALVAAGAVFLALAPSAGARTLKTIYPSVSASKVTFRLFRRSNTGALLNVAGAEAYFSVAIVNARSGKAVVTPVQHFNLSPNGTWQKVGPVDLQRNSLRRGQKYRIIIGS